MKVIDTFWREWRCRSLFSRDACYNMGFDAAMISALKSRPDVGLLIAYPYAGHTYLMSVPAGYNLTSKADSNGKVSFISLAAVRDGKIVVTMVK